MSLSSELLKAFDQFSHDLMEVPLIILASSVLFGLAVIWLIFFEGKENVKDLRKAKNMLRAEIKATNCAPILLRLAWSDAGTYDRDREHLGWPNAGGANGSVRTLIELKAPGNAGLMVAIHDHLREIKAACPQVSWADLVQMAGATAVEESGGPHIPMRYGRKDGVPSERAGVGLNFGLPDFNPRKKDPASHLKQTFAKYGMKPRDVVALSGAHTLGRCFGNRSGAVAENAVPREPDSDEEPEAAAAAGTASLKFKGAAPKTTAASVRQGDTATDAVAAAVGEGTAYTVRGCPFLGRSLTAGGRSWTRNWLTFDNSYYTELGSDQANLCALPTDLCLARDKDFKPHFDEFKASQKAFFAAYAESHSKMSELGAQFDPPDGIWPERWVQGWWRPGEWGGHQDI